MVRHLSVVMQARFNQQEDGEVEFRALRMAILPLREDRPMQSTWALPAVLSQNILDRHCAVTTARCLATWLKTVVVRLYAEYIQMTTATSSASLCAMAKVYKTAAEIVQLPSRGVHKKRLRLSCDDMNIYGRLPSP